MISYFGRLWSDMRSFSVYYFTFLTLKDPDCFQNSACGAWPKRSDWKSSQIWTFGSLRVKLCFMIAYCTSCENVVPLYSLLLYKAPFSVFENCESLLGCMLYQGTWISFVRVISILNRYGFYSFICNVPYIIVGIQSVVRSWFSEWELPGSIPNWSTVALHLFDPLWHFIHFSQFLHMVILIDRLPRRFVGPGGKISTWDPGWHHI